MNSKSKSLTERAKTIQAAAYKALVVSIWMLTGASKIPIRGSSIKDTLISWTCMKFCSLSLRLKRFRLLSCRPKSPTSKILREIWLSHNVKISFRPTSGRCFYCFQIGLRFHYFSSWDCMSNHISAFTPLSQLHAFLLSI